MHADLKNCALYLRLEKSEDRERLREIVKAAKAPKAKRKKKYYFVYVIY